VARIFISYATPDRPVADEVASWLRAAGHEPFLAHDLRSGINVGEDWKQRLYRELREVDAVIGVVTSSFLASSWCSAELGIADTMGYRLMPLRAEADVEHPLMQRLLYADHDQAVLGTPVLDLGEHPHPVLALPVAVLPGPQAQDVAVSLDGHRECNVDRPVRHVPVPDLGRSRSR
jgi:TIR domain-containing protein